MINSNPLYRSYHHSYEGYLQGVVPEHDHDLYLGTQLDNVYNSPFWYNFITEAERRLTSLGISSRGVADGDLGLPGCSFTSLRNEAYIKVPATILQLSDNYTNKIQIVSSEMNASGIVATAAGDDDNSEGVAMILKYPSNRCGWNAARHPNPLLEVIFFLTVTAPLHMRIKELRSVVS